MFNILAHFNTDVDQIIYDINIINNQHTVTIKKKYFVGSGSYGNVYYIGQINDTHAIIKIAQAKDIKYNIFSQDFYFYNKYHSTNTNKDVGLPFLIDFGKSINKIDGKIYDYIIMEYVGIKNIFRILQIKQLRIEETMLFKIIFICLYKQLSSFHDQHLVYRDVSPTNIVASDSVTSYLIDHHPRLRNEINTESLHMKEIVYKKTSFKSICDEYVLDNHNKLVRFVDGGLFGDVDYINKITTYNVNNEYFVGNFIEFDNLDGIFACTMRYVSPFCLFNCSSLINLCDGELKGIVKKLLINLLYLSDYWSLCVIYLIHLYDTNKYTNNYHSYIATRSRLRSARARDSDSFDQVFTQAPFGVKNVNDHYEIYLVKELGLMFSDETILLYEEYENLRAMTNQIINMMISLVNSMLLKANKKNFIHELPANQDVCEQLYNESTSVLQNIDKIINDFNDDLKKNVNSYCALLKKKHDKNDNNNDNDNDNHGSNSFTAS